MTSDRKEYQQPGPYRFKAEDQDQEGDGGCAVSVHGGNGEYETEA